MALKVIISGSRHSAEREIIKKILEEYALFDIEIYDCNDTPTPLSIDGKQGDINQIIQNYDWYILLASTTMYGQYTYREWEAVTESILKKPYDQVITVLQCTNAEKSEQEQDISYSDTGVTYHSFDEFKELCTQKGIKENFYVEYEYDSNFQNLKAVMELEIKKLLRQNLVLRQDSISLKNMEATHVFMNRYRATAEGGFEEDRYLPRERIDDVLDAQKGCSFVIGPSASGKTRAVYEYLKRKKQQSADAMNERLIVVTSHNLEEVVKHVKDYAKLKESLTDRKGMDLATYFFVFDQIGDLLYKAEFVSLFDDLYRSLSKNFSARMLVTGFKENYEALINHVGDRDTMNLIYIQNLKEDQLNQKKIRDFFQLNQEQEIKHTVIGEYVKGLVGYIKSKQTEIEDYFTKYQNEKLVQLFVQSYSVIVLYRNLNLPPLALVLAVMDKILGSRKELDKEQLLDGLLNFFFEKDIFVLEEEGKRVSYNQTQAIECDMDLEYDLYEFDGEQLNLPLSPTYLIRIENDYLWNNFFLDRYAYKVDNICDMKNAMTYYSKAFIRENPLVTLRRIITRSPSVSLAVKYDAHHDFVGPFVEKEFSRRYSKQDFSSFTRKALCEFLAYFIHRAVNIEEFKKRFGFAESILKEGKYAQTPDEKALGDADVHFLLDEINVAELMGFGIKRGSIVKTKVLKFLESQGWNFRQHFGHFIYYHTRYIQYLADFDEVQHYVTSRILADPKQYFVVQDAEKEVNEKSAFIVSCMNRCSTSDDLLQVFDWMEALQIDMSRKILFFLIGLKKKSPMWFMNPIPNQQIVERVAQFLLSPAAEASKLAEDSSDDSQMSTYVIREEPIQLQMKYYYLLELCSTFLNAEKYFYEGLQYWENNIELKNRAVSQWIEDMQNYEFAYMYRVFFKDSKLAFSLPQVSRNLLLKRLSMDDGLWLLDQLFDGSDADSIPDVNTIISLLLANKVFIKGHVTQKIRMNISVRFAFQNLKMILLHPRLQAIPYNISALSLIFLACLTQNQENQIFHDFVKPNKMRSLQNEYGTNYDSSILESKVQEYVREIQARPEYAIDHLRTFSKVDSLISYGKYFIDRMVTREGKDAASMILNPSFVSNLFNQLNYLFVGSYGTEFAMTVEEFRSYTSDLYHYLFEIPHGDKGCIMDYFFKDNYFYAALYRLYPERAVQQEDDGSYRWTPEFMNLPIAFVDEKLFGNVLMGVATCMGADAVHTIESWIIQNVENYRRNPNVAQTIKRFLPDYQFQTISIKTKKRVYVSKVDSDGWGFLSEVFEEWNKACSKGTKNTYIGLIDVDFNRKILQKISMLKQQHPESMPNIAFVHKLLKSGMLSAKQTYSFLNSVFLNYDLVLTPTLWKSALENLRKHVPAKDPQKLDEFVKDFQQFKSDNRCKILDDTSTLCHQLSLLTGKAQQDCFHEIMSRDTFRTQLELCELIQHIELFLPHIDDYIKLMRTYIRNHYMMYDTVSFNDTYSHFINKLLNHYFKIQTQLTYSHKLFIAAVLKSIKIHCPAKDRLWFNQHIAARYEYQAMLEDLEQVELKI